MPLDLSTLYFGEGDAGNEKGLSNYFLQTPEYADLLSGRYNLVIGSKGSGKSALFSALGRATYPNHIMVAASQISGPLEYEVLLGDYTPDQASDEELREFWKKYISIKIGIALSKFSITEGITDEARNEMDMRKKQLDGLIRGLDPSRLPDFQIPKSTTLPLSSESIPDRRALVKAMVGFDYTQVLALCSRLLELNNKNCWILLDRIDEIGISGEKNQIILFNSLLMAMKDIQIYNRIKVIAFIREDLFGKITYPHKDHFDSTTRKISWNRENLLLLISRRIAVMKGVSVDLTLEAAEKLYLEVFDKKIPNSNAKHSFDWAVNHLSDGNGITPRDLILFCNKARESQTTNRYSVTGALISGRALADANIEVAKMKFSEFQVLYPAEAQLANKLVCDEVIENYGNVSREALQRIYAVQNGELTTIVQRLAKCGVLKPDNPNNPAISRRFQIPYIFKTFMGIKSAGRKRES